MVVPADTPVTTPDGAIVATDVLLLTHDKPIGVLFDCAAVAPMHTPAAPAIAPGIGLTATVLVMWHVPFMVYVMVETPTDTAVTRPDEFTVATAGVPLSQTPPASACESAFVKPSHTSELPVIGGG